MSRIWIFFGSFIATFFLTSSVAINLLNQANKEAPASFSNYLLLFIVFSLFSYLFFYKIRDLFDMESKPKVILFTILSMVLSIILILLLKFASSKLIDNNIYDSSAENIANIYATNQYYTSSQKDKERYKNVYQFKEDLIQEIVYLENKKIDIKDRNDIETIGLDPEKDPLDYSFWQILSILILTDDKLMAEYASKIEERHDRKLEKALKKHTDELYDRYYIGYLTAKEDFEVQQNIYNEKVKGLNSINSKIDQDLNFLNSLKQKETSKLQQEVNRINNEATRQANSYISQNKADMIESLYMIKGYKPNGKVCNEDCRGRAKKRFNNKYGEDLGKPYDYWLSLSDKTATTQTLEEGVKLIASKGTSILFQAQPGYLEKNKKSSYVEDSDDHYINLAKNIFVEHYLTTTTFDGIVGVQEKSPSYSYHKKIYAQLASDYRQTDSFKNNVSKEFISKKGYNISLNDVLSEKSFKERAKDFYYKKMNANITKPVFEDMLQADKYQNIIKNSLGDLYTGHIPLNLTNKELAERYLKPAMKNAIQMQEDSIDHKDAYKKMIYPYVMLSFVSFIFLITTIYFIVKSVLIFTPLNGKLPIYLATFLIFGLFLVRINYYDLSESTNMTQAQEISKKLSKRDFVTNMSINTIMYTYPIFIGIEKFKKRIHLDLLTTSYEAANDAHIKIKGARL